MPRTEIDEREFDDAVARLREASGGIVVESGGCEYSLPSDGLLTVSLAPPTVGVSLPTESGPVWEAQRSRSISLRDSPLEESPETVRLDTAIIRWIPGGLTHTLFIARVTDVFSPPPPQSRHQGPAPGSGMHQIEKLATLVPVDDLSAAVGQWSALLGIAPTFVDGGRWAQFDLLGARLALAGTDRMGDGPGLMLKVGDLDIALDAAREVGMSVGPVETGPHERRALATGGTVPIVYYTPS